MYKTNLAYGKASGKITLLHLLILAYSAIAIAYFTAKTLERVRESFS